MMVEMPHRKRNIDITGFPDGLPVVEGFQYCQQSCMLLNLSCHCVKKTGPLMRSQPTPGFKSLLCCFNGLVDLFFRCFTDRGKGFTRCRIDAFEIVFLGGFSPFAVDEKTELVLVIFQPLFSIIRTFGSRTVFHFFVESLQIHVSPHRLTVCRRVTAGHKMFELPFNIGQ